MDTTDQIPQTPPLPPAPPAAPYQPEPGQVVLSERDLERLLDLLDSDAPPPAALVAAAQRYKARRGL